MSLEKNDNVTQPVNIERNQCESKCKENIKNSLPSYEEQFEEAIKINEDYEANLIVDTTNIVA